MIDIIIMIYFGLLIKLLVLRRRPGSYPVFGWGPWVHTLFLGGVHGARFSFLCCCFCLYVFVLCLEYTMLSVSLDCSFLHTPSVFCNVYYPCHFLLKCLYQARTMLLCVGGIDFASF